MRRAILLAAITLLVSPERHAQCVYSVLQTFAMYRTL